MADNSNNQSAGQEGGEGEFGKVEKNFNKKFKTLVALVKGEGNLKRQKVAGGDVEDLVNEFLYEKREEQNLIFKQKVGALLGKYHEFSKTQEEAKKNYQKLVLEARKGFIKEMDAVFGMVDDMNSVERSYAEAIRVFGGDDVPTGDIEGGEDKA